MKIRIVLCVLLALVLVTESGFTREVPPLTGRVNDTAAILSPQAKQQLELMLSGLEKEESTQIAVLTIDSLQGENLENFSMKVVEQWKLGQKDLDNGALLLISRDDRKIRIEVGYGLEGKLTDLMAGRIIRDIITPQFRNGNFDRGVEDGISAMISAVRGEFEAKMAQKSSSSHSQNASGGILIFLIWVLFFIGRVFGKKKVVAGIIGAGAAPLFGAAMLSTNWLMLLAFIPLGFLAGFLSALFFGALPLSSGRSGFTSGGGFGGGGFGGGGGFSGGGGGFGGGGSSGGW